MQTKPLSLSEIHAKLDALSATVAESSAHLRQAAERLRSDLQEEIDTLKK